MIRMIVITAFLYYCYGWHSIFSIYWWDRSKDKYKSQFNKKGVRYQRSMDHDHFFLWEITVLPFESFLRFYVDFCLWMLRLPALFPLLFLLPLMLVSYASSRDLFAGASLLLLLLFLLSTFFDDCSLSRFEFFCFTVYLIFFGGS